MCYNSDKGDVAMSDAIIVGLISGICAIITALASNFATSTKIQHELDKQNAVQNVKIEELTREVRARNAAIDSLTDRIPRLETTMEAFDRRLTKLEQGG